MWWYTWHCTRASNRNYTATAHRSVLPWYWWWTLSLMQEVRQVIELVPDSSDIISNVSILFTSVAIQIINVLQERVQVAGQNFSRLRGYCFQSGVHRRHVCMRSANTDAHGH